MNLGTALCSLLQDYAERFFFSCLHLRACQSVGISQLVQFYCLYAYAHIW